MRLAGIVVLPPIRNYDFEITLDDQDTRLGIDLLPYT